jgi:hypothetical protein
MGDPFFFFPNFKVFSFVICDHMYIHQEGAGNQTGTIMLHSMGQYLFED